jgi:hypothetical protein
MAFLTGFFTIILLMAIFFKDLTWWSWLPVLSRPVFLILLAFINLVAFFSVLASRRFFVERIQMISIVTNLILFAIIMVIFGAMYFLKNIFRM